MLRDACDDARHAAVERRRGQPIERVIADHAALSTFLLDRGETARTLLRALTAPRTPAARASGTRGSGPSSRPSPGLTAARASGPPARPAPPGSAPPPGAGA
jgi:hypothetical protein